MILYNVTINIDNVCHDEWLAWMKNTHIPALMSTGLFVKHTILRLMNEEDNGGTTYAFQYYLRNIEDLSAYESAYSSLHQAEHAKRYGEKFVSFQTILEEVE
ncbi:MAG: DUF4286 family protein [Bacteroidota bacterium]